MRSRLGLPPLPPPPSKCEHKLAHAPRLHARGGGREAANAGMGGRQPTPRLDARRATPAALSLSLTLTLTLTLTPTLTLTLTLTLT